MQPVVLVIHLILALAIIGLVLIQRSEGGGLGIGGGGGGMGGLATAKGAANMLTRATAICAASFFCTSIILGILAGQDSTARQNLLKSVTADVPAATAPVEAGVVDKEVTETLSDKVPAAPLAE